MASASIRGPILPCVDRALPYPAFSKNILRDVSTCLSPQGTVACSQPLSPCDEGFEERLFPRRCPVLAPASEESIHL